MSNPDLAQRLRRLESIVAQSKIPTLERPGASLEDLHLHEIRTQRMRLLTDELAARVAESVDAVDSIELRLLLEDLIASVGHLREVARVARRRCDAAHAAVKEGRMFVRDEAATLLRQSTPVPAKSATS